MADPRKISGQSEGLSKTDPNLGEDLPNYLPGVDEDQALAGEVPTLEPGDAEPADVDALEEDRPRGGDIPVFDRADALDLPRGEQLPVDDENNILPGNENLDEDPNDNGADEQFDPEQIRVRRALGNPLED